MAVAAAFRIMARFTAKQHATRASVGLAVGMVIAIISAVAGYFDYEPGKGMWVQVAELERRQHYGAVNIEQKKTIDISVCACEQR